MIQKKYAGASLAVILAAGLFGSAFAGPQGDPTPEFYKAKIYYRDWDVETRTSQTPEKARSNASAVLTITGSRMAPLLHLLDLSKVTEKTVEPGDARVVFDLEQASGPVTVFYADRFRLYNKNSSLSRVIDDNFKSRLGILLDESIAETSDLIAKEGYVPDADTAVKIAMAVLVPIYGQKEIENELPLKAELKESVWSVYGTLHCGDGKERCLGGVAEIEISKKNGQILRVLHGK